MDAARAAAEAEGYPSFNAYLVALVRADIAEGKTNHALAKRIANFPTKQRDGIDAQLLERAKEAHLCWSSVESAELADTQAVLAGRIDTAPALPFPASARRATA